MAGFPLMSVEQCDDVCETKSDLFLITYFELVSIFALLKKNSLELRFDDSIPSMVNPFVALLYS